MLRSVGTTFLLSRIEAAEVIRRLSSAVPSVAEGSRYPRGGDVERSLKYIKAEG